jgi:hypothetical protein
MLSQRAEGCVTWSPRRSSPEGSIGVDGPCQSAGVVAAKAQSTSPKEEGDLTTTLKSGWEPHDDRAVRVLEAALEKFVDAVDQAAREGTCSEVKWMEKMKEISAPTEHRLRWPRQPIRTPQRSNRH